MFNLLSHCKSMYDCFLLLYDRRKWNENSISMYCRLLNLTALTLWNFYPKRKGCFLSRFSSILSQSKPQFTYNPQLKLARPVEIIGDQVDNLYSMRVKSTLTRHKLNTCIYVYQINGRSRLVKVEPIRSE
jgi:hypothetical protein